MHSLAFAHWIFGGIRSLVLVGTSKFLLKYFLEDIGMRVFSEGLSRGKSDKLPEATSRGKLQVLSEGVFQGNLYVLSGSPSRGTLKAGSKGYSRGNLKILQRFILGGQISRNARIEGVGEGGGDPCEITLIFNYISIKNAWKSLEMRELRVWEEETHVKLH